MQLLSHLKLCPKTTQVLAPHHYYTQVFFKMITGKGSDMTLRFTGLQHKGPMKMVGKMKPPKMLNIS
jgi:hypothetical protein